MTSPARKGVALITGAASAIGAAYAQRLAERGFDLVLVMRQARRLNAVADALERATGRSVSMVEADLSTRSGRSKIETELRNNPSITMLVNCAGVGSAASILVADVATDEAMVDLNVTAMTCLADAAAPVFRARGGGTIINVAAMVGSAADALHGVASASSAYLLSFARLLQADVGDDGVRLQTVLPRGVLDPRPRVGDPPLSTARPLLSADMLVDAALAGLDAGERVSFPGVYKSEPSSDRLADCSLSITRGRLAHPTDRQSAA